MRATRKPTSNPSLLLKLLFASQPLSIQRILTILMRSQTADIRTGKKGLVVLAAHAGAGPIPRLQQRIGHPGCDGRETATGGSGDTASYSDKDGCG